MPPTERIDTFSVEDAHLVRSAQPRRGKPYVHRCPYEAYTDVGWAIEKAGASGFTLEDLVATTQLPHTQVAVALAFLKERGCVETRYRRTYAAADYVYEDALIEYHALREKGAE